MDWDIFVVHDEERASRNATQKLTQNWFTAEDVFFINHIVFFGIFQRFNCLFVVVIIDVAAGRKIGKYRCRQ